MNQSTITTAVVLVALAGVGYLVYKNTQTKTAPPVVQVNTQGNNQPASGSNSTADTINAGTNALQTVAGLFGA